MSNFKKIRRESREIFDYFKDTSKGSSYSNINPEKFYEFADIDINILLRDIKNIEKSSYDEEKLSLLMINLDDIYQSEGTPKTGNERKKSDFILTILVNIVSLFNKKKNRKLFLEREKVIDSEYATGSVEFVITESKNILIVVETKKDDWDKGRAQNMLELISSYSVNVKKSTGNLNKRVYGAVTNGFDWEMYSYLSENETVIGSLEYHGLYHVLVESPIGSITTFERDNIYDFMKTLNTIIEN